jgi:hypothetical protein
VEREEAGGMKFKEIVRIPEDELVIIPPEVSRAAYKIAFEFANETAFRVAREKITSAAKAFKNAEDNGT